MFGLIVVGSVVRTTNSGLACPDWPLCEGRIVPRLDPHVLVEWFHRLLALLVSLMVLATVLWTAGRRAVRRRLGGLAVLAAVLLVFQVLLGALTVWKLLSPPVVSSHLAVALLLFSTLVTMALVADHAAEADPAPPARARGLLPLFAIATALTWAQAVLGGAVSTSGAGLACPDWPTCLGAWVPPLGSAGPGVALHFAHRLGGYTLALLLPVAAWRARASAEPRVRAGARLAVSLVLVQVTLGVTNVLLGTPVWLTALHLATAATLLGTLVATTFRIAVLPAAAPAARAPEPATARPLLDATLTEAR